MRKQVQLKWEHTECFGETLLKGEWDGLGLVCNSIYTFQTVVLSWGTPPIQVSSAEAQRCKFSFRTSKALGSMSLIFLDNKIL